MGKGGAARTTKSHWEEAMQRRWFSAAAILAGALVAAACSQAPAGGGGANKGEIIIASDFPTSGAERSSGRGPEAGVAYAVSLNSNIKGFTITYATPASGPRPLDRSAPDVGKSLAMMI